MGVGIDKNRMLILLVLFWGHQRSQRHFLLQPCSIIHCMPGSRKGGGDGRDYALETTLPTKKKILPWTPWKIVLDLSAPALFSMIQDGAFGKRFIIG